MASIVDVARKAQVAPSTVSLVVNGGKNVGARTRQRVEAAINELGYVPRAARRKEQAARRSRRLAVVYTRHAVRNGAMTALCHSWILGIRQVVEDAGATLNLVAGVEHADRDLMFQQMLGAGEFEGVVIFGGGSNNGYLDRLREANVPVVAMNGNPDRRDLCSVSVDFFGSGVQAAQRLLALGHRRIGLPESEKPLWTTRHAHEGFRQALAKAGLEPIPLTVPSLIDPLMVHAGAAADQMVRDRVTALFTGDHHALEIVNELEGRGIDVPGEISVIGMDHLGFVSQGGKRLSSVSYPKRRMGRLAGRLLLQMLSPRRRLHSATLVLPTHLVAGETTGACPPA